MGGFSTVAKVFLVVVNIIFLVIGLVLLALGLFIRFGSSIINGYVDSAKKSLEASVSSVSTFGTIDLSSFDVTEILRNLAIGLIVAGLLLSILTFLGCCGSCCNIKFMLLAYIITCCGLLVGQVIFIGILYGSPDTIHDPVKKPLKSSIKSDYAGLNGTDIVSIGWNVVMIQVGCCGVDDYSDFTGATKWVIDYTALSPSVTLKTPLACCKTLPTSDDLSCAGTATTESINYLNTGCYDKIWDDTLGNMSLVLGALAGLCVIQLLLVVFALIILCSGGKKKKQKKNTKGNKVRPDDRDAVSPRDPVSYKRKEALRF
ncbi:tetraspanin-18-like [Ruditapes philippinarum]|uniref:tetraspanin-18-like n=1 Tax=Ruditapes philippinarum TaxID=129788 RepID=UPI00295BAF13|nr:tetraspanin-18-like [Ruditapes philippinarum]